MTQGIIEQLPVFDVGHYRTLPDEDDEKHRIAQGMAESLRQTSCLLLRDPDVDASENNVFIDLLERYFDLPTYTKMNDVRPSLHYQVGATPEGTEVPRSAVDKSALNNLSVAGPDHMPTPAVGPDPKWRFFWRVGPRPDATKFAELNAKPVVPETFSDGTWEGVMNSWGTKLLRSVETAAEIVAFGLGLPKRAFTDLMRMGPHLLAPTGTDLEKHGRVGAVVAGCHYDLNFLTIHGRSRFPGLHIWLRDGRRVPVAVPEGCLLVQAGKQMEWLTGGAIKAGYHEVVVTEGTVSAREKARAQGQPLWRVSSTVFAHVASDSVLEPLGPFKGSPSAGDYPPILAGEFVERELEAISLRAPGTKASEAPEAA